MATPTPRQVAAGWSGVGLTLAGILLTELLSHVFPIGQPFPVLLVLGCLVPVAYAALSGGFSRGAIASALLGAYTLHFTSPHSTILDPTAATFQGGAIMLALGLMMSAPMALIRRREQRLRGILERRNAELELANRELMDANAALEAFGYVVSHDLKEPVRAVENYLDAALEEYGSESGRHYVRTAHDANRRLSRMLQGLLAYSRASSTATTMTRLDVAQVLESPACRGQYEQLLREKSGRLEVAPDIPAVMGDEVILSQLLGNVVLNALRHNGAREPVVRVSAAEAPEGRVHLIIEDNGPGFPADVMHRVATLREKRPATVKGGFGLVISHRAAQRLGARMWLSNGSGAQVHLEIEAAPPSTHARLPHVAA